MKQLQVYTYTIPALGSVQIPAPNDNWIVTASTGQLAVRGDTFGKLTGIVAGQGLKSVPFSRLELIDESGAPNTVTILLAPVEFVNQVFSGSVTLVQPSIDSLANLIRRPLAATGSYKATTLINANVADPVFLAAANVNGAILLTAQMCGRDAAGFARQAFITKATAPANILDGEVILQSEALLNDTAATTGGQLDGAQFIPAGLGLYYITDLGLNAVAPNMRSARYILL